MKVFAFLDVDQTLLYNNNTINDALLDALLKKGITEIYLFTNMDMKEIKNIGRNSAPLSRYKLIEHIEKKGLKVLGVITPADPGFFNAENKLHPIGHAYETLYKSSYKHLEEAPLFNAKDELNPNRNVSYEAEYYFNKFLWDTASYISKQKCTKVGQNPFEIELPELTITYENNTYTCPDKITLELFIQDCKENGYKYSIDMGSNTSGSQKKLTINPSKHKDNKALMMEVVLPELIRKYGDDIAIFYADDREDHLDGVKEIVTKYNEENKKNTKLYTLLMNEDYNIARTMDYETPLNEFIELIQDENKISDSLFIKVLSSTEFQLAAAGTGLIIGIVLLSIGTMGVGGVIPGLVGVGAIVFTAIGASTTICSLGLGAFSIFQSKENIELDFKNGKLSPVLE